MSLDRLARVALVLGVAFPLHSPHAQVTSDHVKFVLSSLAHDSMEGRGTGTPGSMRAAKFIAEQFRLAGLQPAGDSGFFQHVPMVTRSIDPSSTLVVDGTTLRLGVDFSVSAGRADPASFDGAQVIFGGVAGDTTNALTADQVRGKLVLLLPAPPANFGGGRGRAPAPASCREAPADSTARGGRRGGGGAGGGRGRGGFGGANAALQGAAGIATIEGPELAPRTVWAAKHKGTAFVKDASAGPSMSGGPATVQVTNYAAEVLLGMKLTSATKGMLGKTVRSTVKFIERPALGGNVVGIIPGADAVHGAEVVLIDAHYDHLGIAMPAAGSTDSVYNGADDDASGTTSVIEIARAIKAGSAPKRTLVFIATTGEEVGLLGTNWYIAHPVRPLAAMVANLEIEMMDRPDSLAGGLGHAWLTGFERSTMGDTLAAHGLPIMKDPRPDQNFFGRSDNIAFARMGIPAHTLSSFDLHADYHRANDEVGLANFDHMTGVINAAVTAVRLLGNGFTPQWYPGCKP
jgi:peptidase M28-like protein